MRQAGSLAIFPGDFETVAVQSIGYLIHDCVLLTKSGLIELVEHFVEILPQELCSQVTFRNGRPSNVCVQGFIQLHGLLKL